MLYEYSQTTGQCQVWALARLAGTTAQTAWRWLFCRVHVTAKLERTRCVWPQASIKVFRFVLTESMPCDAGTRAFWGFLRKLESLLGMGGWQAVWTSAMPQLNAELWTVGPVVLGTYSDVSSPATLWRSRSIERAFAHCG